MKHFKKLLAVLLAAALLLGLLPTLSFASNGKAWDRVVALEQDRFAPLFAAGETPTEQDYIDLIPEVVDLVLTADDYAPGTCTYETGMTSFFWEDVTGEPCFYSPALRAKTAKVPAAVNVNEGGKTEVVTFESKREPAVRQTRDGGSTAAKDVYVIGPWYGKDASFSDQYKNEGKSLAAATGGTFTCYSGTSATINNVANAIQSGAVVFFDSHGVTDDLYGVYAGYSLPEYDESVYDYVTRANTSYLTLTSGNGITAADKAIDNGVYHYVSFTDTTNNQVFCVDGTCIANHMTQNAPNNMLWMAICLGMATEGLFKPLRAKGVAVVYGYSQSVTFYGDYVYEECFWKQMKSGATVKDAFATMTNTWGPWDPVYYRGCYDDGYGGWYIPTEGTDSYYDTVDEARKYCVAFPNVVSAEDAYQGHRTSMTSNFGACSVQTVYSTWRLTDNGGVTPVDPPVSTDPVVTFDPCGGSVDPATQTFPSGSPLTDLPVPTRAGYRFLGWYTAANGGNKLDLEEGVTVTADVTFYAHWYKIPDGLLYGCYFEDDEDLSGWQIADVDGDDFCWELRTSDYYCYEGSQCLTSASYVNDYGPLDPDNWVVAPLVTLPSGPSYVSLFAWGQDVEYYAEHFAIYAGTSLDDMYPVSNEFVATNTPTQYTADLSAYAGKSVYIAVRHFNCTDEFYLNLDVFEVCRGEAASWPFVDVTTSDWFYNAVAWAISQNPRITSGVDASHFAPYNGCSRAEVVTFLWNAAGQPKVSADNPFYDVSSGDWFYNAVMWAVANGITKGIDEHHFAPGKTCTRAEVVQFLWNAAGNPAVSGTLSFNDVADGDWFCSAVMWAVANRITSGTGDGKQFEPGKTCSRSEVVQFLMKADELS